MDSDPLRDIRNAFRQAEVSILSAYGVTQFSHDNQDELIFYIAVADDDVLLNVDLPLQVTINAGIMYEDRATPLLLIIGINAPEWECEYWINVHDPREGFRPLDALERQQYLYFVLIGPTRRRKFIIDNSLAPHLNPIHSMLTETLPWSMDDFNAAKAVLQDKYTLEELKGFMTI
ncbi:MAG: hypothetical protein RBT34_06605 [Anaerolineaceae bacterium]|jgi:hypothetical protein|nr:hypothetical protein [Anaerolineaceae bacterium]MDY0280588.1 hypothetical protein [Salinivirgaceae bacterium]